MEFAMLPTPTAMDSTNATAEMKSSQVKEGSMHSVTLTRAMAMGLLPTPLAVHRDHPERVEALKATGANSMNSRKNGELRPNSIMDFINFHQMLPTPVASDKNGGTDKLSDKFPRHTELKNLMSKQTGKPSQLNPQFVAEMMGFPTNWTELPFQNGETNH
jgi:hypothetical protein